MALPSFGDRRKQYIGVLGGSFNPAHEGHLHISVEALRRVGVDQVWWLVSPQNPLKPVRGMATLATRMTRARTMAADRRIVVSDLERKIGSTKTAAVLAALRRRFPRITFVWLMGADNLQQIPLWWRWTRVFRTASIAVFDRSPYSYAALAGAAAIRFGRRRKRNPRALLTSDPPAWSYLAIRRHPASGTALRESAPRIRS
ncbi:MAG: nicotinate-nicotinamide nucleotide adenylyltransferase [Alphaproteobacteria bacterium]|nr:nicotinate-nicotinamide nucleotide adenylyltransferase [Alphaproteobacteria bacterium]